MLSRREALTTGAFLLATAFATPLTTVARGAQKTIERPGRFRLSDGRILAYCEYGDSNGPLVFYFHGTPGSRLEPGLVEADIRNAGIRLIAVDRPGIGRSTYQSGRQICNWPKDVIQLADALGYAGTNFGVVGFSGGAPYALACARFIPYRLTHAVVVSGHAWLGAPAVSAGVEDKIIALITNRPRISNMGLNLVSRRLDRKPDKVVKRVMKHWAEVDRQLILCNPNYYRFLINNLDEAIRCGTEGLATDVRLLACPWGFELCEIQGIGVSIWQGGCDTISPPSTGRFFHSQIVGSELHIDPRASHITMFKWHAAEILSQFAGLSS
jgi:pimeloyl-ACP methyl ester carboxylesterase